MQATQIIFIVLSIVILIYFISISRTSKRIPLIWELFFSGVYALILVLFLFPQTIGHIENIFGISSAINFFVYSAIFVAFFLIYLLYRKNENLRQDITKLTREIALMNSKKK